MTCLDTVYLQVPGKLLGYGCPYYEALLARAWAEGSLFSFKRMTLGASLIEYVPRQF